MSASGKPLRRLQEFRVVRPDGVVGIRVDPENRPGWIHQEHARNGEQPVRMAGRILEVNSVSRISLEKRVVEAVGDSKLPSDGEVAIRLERKSEPLGCETLLEFFRSVGTHGDHLEA